MSDNLIHAITPPLEEGQIWEVHTPSWYTPGARGFERLEPGDKVIIKGFYDENGASFVQFYFWGRVGAMGLHYFRARLTFVE